MDWYNGMSMWSQIVLATVLLTINVHSVTGTTATTSSPATIVFNTTRRNTFGEFCNSTVKCKAQSWLSCRPIANHFDDGIKDDLPTECQCWDKDSMMYEEHYGKCVSKAGESCKFQVENPLDNTMTSLMTICVSNASCHPVDGICKCDSRHYENTNGTCSVSQSIQKPCSPSLLQCSSYEGLFCNLTNSGTEQIGVCTCNETVSEYLLDEESPEASQCVGLPESPCINDKCVANANCSKSESVNVCKCESNFYMDDQKRCQIKKAFSEACSHDQECQVHKQLICHNGRCDCGNFTQHGTALQHKQPKNYDYYDYGYEKRYQGMEAWSSTQCLGLVDKPCQKALCVPYAYCEYTTYPYGICKCQPYYFESRTGNCGYQYGDTCTHKDNCIDGLFCRQGKCSCRLDDQKFDVSTKTCQSTVDGPCNDNDNDFGGASCTKNAVCTTLNGGNGTKSGICKCQAGFVENINGECEVEFGQSCSAHEVICDAAADLICIDKICQCKTFSKYDKELRVCLTLVGGKCNLKEEKMISQCVINASCVKKLNNLGHGYGNCQCNAGYKVTLSYTCQPSAS